MRTVRVRAAAGAGGSLRARSQPRSCHRRLSTGHFLYGSQVWIPDRRRDALQEPRQATGRALPLAQGEACASSSVDIAPPPLGRIAQFRPHPPASRSTCVEPTAVTEHAACVAGPTYANSPDRAPARDRRRGCFLLQRRSRGGVAGDRRWPCEQLRHRSDVEEGHARSSVPSSGQPCQGHPRGQEGHSRFGRFYSGQDRVHAPAQQHREAVRLRAVRHGFPCRRTRRWWRQLAASR